MSSPGKNTKQKQPRKNSVDPNLCPTFKDINTGEIIKNSLGGGELAEGLPTFNRLACENVISGQNNTWIVLGRDRPGGSTSGNINATQAGAIDIVVGRMGQQVRQCGTDGNNLWTDPIFSGDAGRIYISQNTTIDKNFNLAAGTIGSPGLYSNGKVVAEPVAESGIGIKADQVRIIARRSIKLVTMGKQEGPSGGDKNYRSIQGINIIAGNKSEGKDFALEPLVKGRRLEKALQKIKDLIEAHAGITHRALQWQDEISAQLKSHKHIWGNGQVLTTVSEPLSSVCQYAIEDHAVAAYPDYEDLMKKLESFRNDFTKESGDDYISSYWNFVN